MIAMNHLERRHTLLRRMATLCVVLVLTITSISAFIRLSNAGLGCSDWPQCYGSKLRQAQQGIETKAVDSPAIVTVRLLHRATAVAALVVIITMMMVCFSAKPVLWREGGIDTGALHAGAFPGVITCCK